MAAFTLFKHSLAPAALLSIAALSTNASAQATPQGVTTPPANLIIEYPKADLLALHPRASIINQHLLRAERSVSVQRATLADAVKGFPHRMSPNGLQLDVYLDRVADGATIAKLQAAGCTVLYRSPRYPRIALETSDLRSIYRLADLTEVLAIHPEFGAQTQGSQRDHTGRDNRAGSVDGKGPHAIGADVAWGTFGVDGSGVKVGVLSDSAARGTGTRDGDTQPPMGIAGTLTGTRPQDLGDLPATIDLRADDANASSDEGSGMMELVHDMAPGAPLAFHTAFVSQAGFADGIFRLFQDAQCGVVVDDVIYFSEPMWQDGIIAQAAAACVNNGVPYFSSAGNYANRGYFGQYVDLNPAQDSENEAVFVDYMDFIGGGGDGVLDVVLDPGGFIRVAMQWNQPHAAVNSAAGAQIDLDLYLYNNSTLDIVAQSTSVQGTTGSPGGDAFEILQFSSTSGGSFGLVVDHWAGQQDSIPQNNGVPLQVRFVYVDLGGASVQGLASDLSDTGAPTIFGHSMAPGVVGVAAVPWWEAQNYNPELFFPTTLPDPEDFTSRGGNLTVMFAQQGFYLERTSFEPEISCIDANNTTFFGSPSPNLGGYEGEPDALPNFFGTSAAAPNAAGVAALMLNRNPQATPAQIIAAMTNTVFEINGRRAATGTDDVSGIGLIDAFFSIQAIGDGAPGASAQDIKNFLLGFANQPTGADRNGDSAINVADIVRAVNED